MVRPAKVSVVVPVPDTYVAELLICVSGTNSIIRKLPVEVAGVVPMIPPKELPVVSEPVAVLPPRFLPSSSEEAEPIVLPVVAAVTAARNTVSGSSQTIAVISPAVVLAG